MWVSFQTSMGQNTCMFKQDASGGQCHAPNRFGTVDIGIICYEHTEVHCVGWTSLPVSE